uniref:Uncharacterized protein n=1 Tax=Tanacetum cinerariifolium TaxID=118510 RepID=A0A699HDD7_TANCI|nr:hypothetical protein [Tanacetum cinerariifolium]
MDDPNITMEEYIRLEEEKAQKHGRTFNWQIATYRKMEYYEEEDDSLKNFKTEYPAIRYPWLRYQVDEYAKDIVHNYEQRLEMIRERMSDTEMGLDVDETLCFQLGGSRRRMPWRRFILALGLHTNKEMAEDGFGAYWLGSERVIPDKGDLMDYWIEILSDMDFLRPTPSYVFIFDPVRRLCHRMISCSIFGGGRHLRRHAEGRKSRARLSGGHFIGCLAAHFGLASDQGLRGLSMVTHELPLIDLHELGRLNSCVRVGDTWARVAPRPKRQLYAAAGAAGTVEDAPAVDEGAQADPASVQAPQPLPHALKTMQQRISKLEEELLDTSGRTYRAFDSTLVGSLQLPYQRRTRRRTSDASTSAPQQLDP